MHCWRISNGDVPPKNDNKCVVADPPGMPGDASIVNDLDLVVTVTPFTGALPTGPHTLRDALAVCSVAVTVWIWIAVTSRIFTF